jgi:hypothetical protein
MRTIRIPTSVYAADSPLSSHGDQVLVNHLARSQLEIAQTAREFTLPSGPATENEENEEVTDGNIGTSVEPCELPPGRSTKRSFHSTKGSKELTDGSNAVQQQDFAIVSMTRQTCNSDPAAPTVVQDAILLDPLVRLAKDALSLVLINTLIISD